MKFFSFKILAFCIILPPVFYVLTLQFMETQLQKRYSDEIKDVYISDTTPLFDGQISLKDAVKKNIDQYLSRRILPTWGAVLKVVVTTRHGIIIYPASFEEEDMPLPAQDPIRLATENYDLLNDGLKVNVDLEIKHNTLISNTILSFYLLVSVIIFYYYYAAGIKRIKAQEHEKDRKIGRLLHDQEQYTSRIKNIDEERQKLSKALNNIKRELSREKVKADRTETDLIDEIVALEAETEKNLSLRRRQQDEIKLLREQLERLEKSKHRIKAGKNMRKRFKALYKNITISNKAIDGYLALPEDMKIKSEELIHQLNEDPSVVSIKRKVFAKKSKKTVFEVIFAYSGRLYFSNKKDNKIDLLIIGTKNTQNKDLEFLDNL